MAGRRRKPTALKRLAGEKRPSRLNPDEPMPERGIVIPDALVKAYDAMSRKIMNNQTWSGGTK